MNIHLIVLGICMYILSSIMYLRKESEAIDRGYATRMQGGGIFKFKQVLYVCLVVLLPILMMVDYCKIAWSNREGRYTIIFLLEIVSVIYLMLK